MKHLVITQPCYLSSGMALKRLSLLLLFFLLVMLVIQWNQRTSYTDNCTYELQEDNRLAPQKRTDVSQDPQALNSTSILRLSTCLIALGLLEKACTSGLFHSLTTDFLLLWADTEISAYRYWVLLRVPAPFPSIFSLRGPQLSQVAIQWLRPYKAESHINIPRPSFSSVFLMPSKHRVLQASHRRILNHILPQTIISLSQFFHQ